MQIETISYQVITISETEYPTFPLRLQFAMTLRECTSKELADRIYVSHSTVSGYRSGSRMPSGEMLRSIATELEVSTDFLLCLNNHICISQVTTPLPQK